MKKNKGSCAALAALMLICAVFSAFAACSGNANGNSRTGNDNPFRNFPEVVELNDNIEMPAVMGESESKLASIGFEYYSGAEHHLTRYRSTKAQDLIYTMSTYEMQYGEPDPSLELYVTGFRIMPENKTIEKNPDGSTYPVYTTSRSVFGIKLGDDIKQAREVLFKKGYEIIYEETKNETGLPKTYEYSYRKGAVMISIGAERGDDISQMNVWIPYYDEDINALNKQSDLPADLGLIYSVVTNKDFSYAGKNSTSRRYETEDGCIAIMRGFPDYIDMSMTCEVSFTSDKYNVLGVKVGMTEDEARTALINKGCSRDSDNVYVFNAVAAVQLTVENGIVTRLAATLKPSTNITGIEVEG